MPIKLCQAKLVLLLHINLIRTENPRVPSSILGLATNKIKDLAKSARSFFCQGAVGVQIEFLCQCQKKGVKENCGGLVK